MTLYDVVLAKREDMKYPVRRIIAEILKEAFIHDENLPKIIKVIDAEYVSEDELNRFTQNLGIKVVKVKTNYTALKPGNWKCNLVIELENDSKLGLNVS